MKIQKSVVGSQGSETTKHRSYLVYRLSYVLGLLFIFSLFSAAHAKIYVDISSPGARQLPITIKTMGPMKAKEIEWIVKSDLEATGIFEIVDPDVPGAEIIANLEVDMSGGLKVVLSVNDLIENREVLKKRFDASKVIIRPMAHSIANDIYKVVTGREGVFRTRISYLKILASGKKELRYMDWDGYNSKRMISRGLTTSHSWSRDGRYLFYSAERKRKWKIYLLDLDNFRESLLFSSKGLNIVGGSSSDGLISFSSSKDGSSEIYTINQYGKKLKKLTRSFGINVSPVFSPDGEKIAFVSDRGGTPQIYVITSQGKNLRRVTYEGSYNTSPSWSYDGESIAYTGRSNGKFQIFVVQSDGTDLRQLTINGNNESPSFSPDGIFLVFDSDRDGKRGIYVMRSNGEAQKKITGAYVNAMTPKWSPYLKK
jgi:TolB protein